MPKSASKKRNHTQPSAPYTKPPTNNAAFKMNTDLGQHVLKNPGVADAIVNKADLKQSDVVLEIGPGTGNLTVRILEKAKRCIAIEADARMAAETTKRVQGTPAQKRLDILLGDAIKTTFPPVDVVISNTPYQISSPLVFKILAAKPAPRVCLLMFQREFAMRLVARPGDKLYSRLSVNTQMWAKVDHILKVGRNNFRPPPQVESSVIRLVPKTPRPAISFAEWDGLLRICFVRKNKTLRASFLGMTSVMDMIECNYRTWCAQHDIVLDDGPGHTIAPPLDDSSTQDGEVDEMDVDPVEEIPEFMRDELAGRKGGSKKKKKGKAAALVWEKTSRVLEETGLAEKRARMCDEGDFLRLLHRFNEEGVHFN